MPRVYSRPKALWIQRATQTLMERSRWFCRSPLSTTRVPAMRSPECSAACAQPGPGGTNETIPDSTGGGSYTLRPANLCLLNTAPVAHLTADVDHGDLPLTVQFDGSSSNDPDSIDTIASYTF